MKMGKISSVKSDALNAQLAALRTRWENFWGARSDQERRLLSIGAAVVVLAVVYLVLVDPALTGRARLTKSLPQLRLNVAELTQMSQQAQALAGQNAGEVPQLDSQSIEKSLQSHGMKASSTADGADYVRVQLSGVSFANVMSWLDEMRNVYRVRISEAKFEAKKDPGRVDASLTLRQAGENS